MTHLLKWVEWDAVNRYDIHIVSNIILSIY
jgi:hypothetical protein